MRESLNGVLKTHEFGRLSQSERPNGHVWASASVFRGLSVGSAILCFTRTHAPNGAHLQHETTASVCFTVHPPKYAASNTQCKSIKILAWTTMCDSPAQSGLAHNAAECVPEFHVDVSTFTSIPQLPGQLQLLRGHVEEGGADVLAVDSVPRRRRAGHPAQGRVVQHRARGDDAQLAVAHRGHAQPGACGGRVGGWWWWGGGGCECVCVRVYEVHLISIR